MFYAHFVLSKKGPLARVWLAAHWDKKLTKAHVFETNLEQSVDSIIEPKVKMALRTSGHLLLGVVRIYSRKAKYLLADCNEAFVKIKMAFRPGAVDLPEENREANLATITLPEVFHDFDTTMADLTDIDVQPQFNLNQSRAEEITIREDYGNITLVGDDGFGDMGFDEREMLREGPSLDEPLMHPSDGSNLLLEESHKKDGEVSLDKQMEMDYDKPLQDDGFGGAVGEGLLGDANFMEEGAGLFDDAPMEENRLAHGDGISSDDGGDIGGGFESDGDDYEPPAAVHDDDSNRPGPSTQPFVPPPPEAQTQIPFGDHSAILPDPGGAQAEEHEQGDQTTLIQNEEEAFTLEPLDATNVLGNERVRVKRKRKLVIDEIKGIDGDDMRAQLSDTSDIVTTLDLAPPTKKLMHWKETGGVEKLFALPGRALHSRALAKLFTRNLATKAIFEDEFDHEIPVEDRLELEKELQREADVTEKDFSHVREQESRLEEPPVALTEAAPATPARAPEQLEQHHPELVNLAPPDENPQQHIDQYDDPVTPGGPITPFTPGPIDDEREKDMSPKTPQPAEEEENLQPEEGENVEQFEERRWNKRSQQMLYTLHRALKDQDEASFIEITRKNTRKQAASKFYMLLVLKKQAAIDVNQNEAFDDIIVTKGANFQKVLDL